MEMKVYAGIIELTDYDCHGYAIDETIGLFSNEDIADSTTKRKYTESKDVDSYESSSIIGYRVDEYVLDGGSYKRGITKWIDDDGKWQSQQF